MGRDRDDSIEVLDERYRRSLELQISRRLLPVRRELREMVLSECNGDFIRAEKYYAELFFSRQLADVIEIKNEWPLAGFLHMKVCDIAKSGPHSVSANDVWRIFRSTFFGHANWCEAEILARQLLWQLAVTLEGGKISPEAEQAAVSYVANIHNVDSLSGPHLYRSLINKLLDVLHGYHGYRNRKNENFGMVSAEAWYRFRRLLSKHRSQVYSTL